jgi:hypothetical protein
MPAPRIRHRVCCNAEDARPVGEAILRKLAFDWMKQRTEVGSELQTHPAGSEQLARQAAIAPQPRHASGRVIPKIQLAANVQ